MIQIQWDESSFRDPATRLGYFDSKAVRRLSKKSALILKKLKSAEFFNQLIESGEVLDFEIVSGKEFNDPEYEYTVSEKISPISYSYEWSFEMLRDAALQQLRLTKICLENDFILKDGSAFNSLFKDNQVIFIDHGSFEEYKIGQAWQAYSQFCRSFLFPLLISSHRQISPQKLILASCGEISLETAKSFFSFGDSFKPGVLKDIFLQDLFRSKDNFQKDDAAQRIKAYKISKAALLANIKRLQKLVQDIKPPKTSTWVEYEKEHTYSDESFETKKSFVTKHTQQLAPHLALDLGCNTGAFSELIASSVGSLISCDLDSLAIDRFYKSSGKIHGLSLFVQDIAMPSPRIGWRLQERASFLERIQPDLVLALALIHHLRISSGVPLVRVLDLFKELSKHTIIEWVGRKDPQVKKLLALREDVFDDYHQENFITLVQDRFEIKARQKVPHSDRELFLLSRT